MTKMKQTTKMSRTVGQLEKMFNTIKDEMFNGEMPETVITVTRTRGSAGHSTTQRVWTKGQDEAYELNISSETLSMPIEEVLDTMIHEMIHLHCRLHDLKEVSANGYYHNSLFKKLAEERHLKVVDAGKYGWNTEAAGNDWLTEYALNHDWTDFKTYQKKDLSELFAEILTGMQIKEEEKKPDENKGQKKPGSYIRWQCPNCKAIVRSTKKVNIVCGDCQITFIET